MKIMKAELVQKLNKIKGIVPKTTTMPVLQSILVKDGYLIANNMETTVKAKLEGAGGVEQDHADDKYCQGQHMGVARGTGCLDQQRGGSKKRQQHTDEMGEGTARILDFKRHDQSLLRRANIYISTHSFKNYIKLFYILYTFCVKNAMIF